MTRETLRVTWKIIRRAGQGRNVNTYCSYIVENNKYKHKLKTIKGTKLFDLLENNMICVNELNKHNIYVDGVYKNNKLICVSNARIM